MKHSVNNWILKIFILLVLSSAALMAQRKHPNLVINQEDIKVIKDNLGKAALFDETYNKAKTTVDEALNRPIDVPLPNDPGGGYTHEKHKSNYNEMYLAGIIYNVTGEPKYAGFIKQMLLKYSGLIPALKKHPFPSASSPGRLFYQSLNETVWIFNSIQAYDCIYNYLSKEDRNTIESKVFRPMVNYFFEEHLSEFDRIHNHGTWMTAAIGMVGYTLGDKDIVEKALHGSTKKDEGGFLAQLNLLFSPDGYYVEGAYYVRYALMPFFLFSQAIENNQPELKIFEYRQQILKKAFYSAMQLTYTNGEFIPINDALKEKTYHSVEAVHALDIVYKQYGNDKSLLPIAKDQNQVTLNGAGMLVAKDIGQVKEIPGFGWKSVEYSDGPDGRKGGIAILRSGAREDQLCLLHKYTTHGMEHGHYDKLSFLFYDQGREILQDYGSARFINIEQKQGGRYLPENEAWARQTIAHNTVTVDEASDYSGKIKVASIFNPDKYYFSAKDPDFQVSSAKDEHAYDGVRMHRTLAMVNDKSLGKPVVIDIFRLSSDKEHQYDYPFYYKGQFISTNFKYLPFTSVKEVLGKANGYQYLWKDASGKADSMACFTWWNNRRFYSISTAADPKTDLFFTGIGANDPNFNLRNEPGFMIRQKAANHTFATVIEPHGDFNPTLETSSGSSSQISMIKVLHSDETSTVVEISGRQGFRWTLLIANNDALESSSHKVSVAGKEYTWTGPVSLLK